jgi:hypothetical protein
MVLFLFLSIIHIIDAAQGGRSVEIFASGSDTGSIKADLNFEEW